MKGSKPLVTACLLLAAALFPALPAFSEEAYRPSPAPDRIILTWPSDPSTSMSVSWRTAVSDKRARAEIAAAADGPGFADQARTVEAVTAPFRSGPGEAQYHTVRFTGLKPDTLYAYRVGDGSNWSEWNQFRTAAGGPQALTFLYTGDAQNDIFSKWSRVIRAGYRLAPGARFIIHAGDLVNRGSDDKLWGEWFGAAGWINAVIPSLPSPGNHEYSSRKITAHWRAQFDLPEHGPAGLEETCYYVDVQGVRIVSLNSNEQLEEQARWLDEVLSGNRNRWTIITFHHPVFSPARSRDNARVRSLWQPVFDKHGVDLVLQGHDHTYARSGLLAGEGAEPGKSGTVYVVSVGGPKMYKLDGRDWMKRAAQDIQLIQIIRIDGGRLRFEARTPTGRLHDAFELNKRSGMANLLVEHPAGLAPAEVPGAR